MTPLLYTLPGHERFGKALAAELGAELAGLELHRFPDGETRIRILTEPWDRTAVVAWDLQPPDARFVPMALTVATLRDLGARHVGLVAPYLPYMRQDARFSEGEGVTARYFAALLGRSADWLVTVDPHLHRIASLDAIFDIPALAVTSAPVMARFIAENVERPLVVGPDVESERWVATVAAEIDAPHAVLAKTRLGDRAVRHGPAELGAWAGRTPVLVDDIASTGVTLESAARLLVGAGLAPPTCVVVHAVFAESAAERLGRAPIARLVTTDTIPHETNGICVAPAVARAVRTLLSP